MKVQTATETEYPETDGRPMGETDLHREWMIRIIELLKHRYRGQCVYVTGDLLFYYEEGNSKRFVVPDAMVVKDSDPGRRRIFKLWEERLPCVVFETTSRCTRRKDSTRKSHLYETLRIPEYFLYDPTADYLRPPLQGHRLTNDQYVLIEPDADGRLLCSELGLWLRLEDGDLVMYDCQSGERLLTEAEAERAAREAEHTAREAERAAAQAEIQRLRDKLREQGS